MITAKELQEKKLRAELEIMKILKQFNQVCIENDFQLEGATLNIEGNDANRTFEIDLYII